MSKDKDDYLENNTDEDMEMMALVLNEEVK